MHALILTKCFIRVLGDNVRNVELFHDRAGASFLCYRFQGDPTNVAIKGQSLELFFIDGRPDGMLTAEVFNWTGHVLMTPRTQLADALKRREAHHTGVYILLGETDEGRTRAYIGESEDISERIRTHDAKLDWWTSAILVTSTANNLHKVHVKYLEARLVEQARQANRFLLENGNTPPRSSLSEAASTNMEQFLEQILLVLPAIRVDGFLLKTRIPGMDTALPKQPGDGLTAKFEMKTPRHGIAATALLKNGEFIVEAGSVGRSTWEGPPTHSYRALFDELAASGIFSIQGDHRVFAKSYAFRSPSAAGAVLNGRATNGPESWRVAGGSGKTYKEWETDQLQPDH